MTSVLTPSATRYNGLNSDDRYNYRRLLRSLVRWYGYCSQILRMFDKDLHKEAVFVECRQNPQRLAREENLQQLFIETRHGRQRDHAAFPLQCSGGHRL